jgi:hypothetical protein
VDIDDDVRVIELIAILNPSVVAAKNKC